MKSKGIPKEVKEKAEQIIEAFNQKTFGTDPFFYQARFRGKFLYLDRYDYDHIGPICRLTYTGRMDHWAFAIFKWSSGRYDPDEWMFPGSEHLNGTIEGRCEQVLRLILLNCDLT